MNVSHDRYATFRFAQVHGGMDRGTQHFQGWDGNLRVFPGYIFSGLTKKEFCDGDRSLMGRLNYEIGLADRLTGHDFREVLDAVLDEGKGKKNILNKKVVFSCDRMTKEAAEKLYSMAKEQGLTVSAFIAKELHLPTKTDLPKEKPMPHMMKDEDKVAYHESFTLGEDEYQMAAEDVKPYVKDGKQD